jgi:hypothetical protein
LFDFRRRVHSVGGVEGRRLAICMERNGDEDYSQELATHMVDNHSPRECAGETRQTGMVGVAKPKERSVF